MTKTLPLTKEQAEQIRRWRIEEDCTWRSVASLAAKEWPELGIQTHLNGCGYQSEGQDLCQEAAEFFGENAGEEPWN